jgi:hypothetical protein
MRQVLKTWANNKDDFIMSIHDGEYCITKDNKLVFNDEDLSGVKIGNVKHTFLLYGLAPYHTTDWLRFFCGENHPEIDFDKEFETDTPGVFERYHQRFGHDYEDWVWKAKYDRLKEEVEMLGYVLGFQD